MNEPHYRLQGVVHSKQEDLDDFEGPLDVILLLLSKNKIEIQNIPISAILEQYMAFIEHMKELDMEIASEFIAMASHLMLIKTKMLLSFSEQQEAMTEMELLIRSLEDRQRIEAYAQIKKAMGFLGERNEYGSGQFIKEPEPLSLDATYQYQHDLQDLVDTMLSLSQRGEELLPPTVHNFAGIVGAEPYSVLKKASQVLKRLMETGSATFKSLFTGNNNRSEIVATFLSILELCKMNCVELSPDETEDITVTFVKMPDETEKTDVKTAM